MADPVSRLLLLYGGVSVLTLILFGWDKAAARRQQSRIPEAALLAAAALGGAFGGVVGMYLFRHKTRKPLFRLSVPLFLILQAVLLAAAHQKV